MTYEKILGYIIGLVLGVLIVKAISSIWNYYQSRQYEPIRYLDYAIGVLTNNGLPRDSCIKAVARLKRHRKQLMEKR